MSYSTNPVLDQMRHQDSVDWGAQLHENRVQSLYDDTMDLVKRGDCSRILETFSWDDANGRVAVAALNVSRAYGSVSAAQALQHLARIWAEQHAKV